ncbi:hypothetical protein K435DRAFT_710834 [Dendrothele bispora CBS 962.96]|uniref:Uncharacterized protein n=1 Tax=Dendrothele bispora (strain CBS 962.96) TaxID=1314807 RepID=A0A4S8MTW5_DENBC|nr:hypothetical protein K435DRAFT_710834 [Dendrothele bispora CBS 962.96]
MAHTSPATFLVWAIASVMLGVFLVYHLWSFDRFKCLKWNNGPHSGAFKRVMTYSYLLSVPCILAFSVGFAIIKYTEGFVALPLTGVVIPKPFTEWAESSQKAIIPLIITFTVGWSFEMVTHLEELCFWLFLVNAGSGQEDWFKSRYFKIWVVGSIVAVVYMPLTAAMTRDNVIRCEAVAFLAGSTGGLILTICFLPVLFSFPSFLANLKQEGVDTATIVRLTKFHELNTIRVVFRFLFCGSLFVLGVDGVRPHTHTINDSMILTDVLAISAAFGCVVSSGITLVIFFPRDIGSEIANRDAARERKRLPMSNEDAGSHHSRNSGTDESIISELRTQRYLLTSSPVQKHTSLPHDDSPTSSPYTPMDKSWRESEVQVETLSRMPPMRPNRKKGNDIELGGIGPFSTNSSLSRRTSVNPAVFSYTSPINLAYGGNSTSDISRLTFARR